jgi:hypothetical protein
MTQFDAPHITGVKGKQMGRVERLADLDHYYTFGDVYEALDACEQLETRLNRLKRQHILSHEQWTQSLERVAGIRRQLEDQLNRSALTPKAPRLP